MFKNKSIEILVVGFPACCDHRQDIIPFVRIDIFFGFYNRPGSASVITVINLPQAEPVFWPEVGFSPLQKGLKTVLGPQFLP
jgi:hypothetical protein